MRSSPQDVELTPNHRRSPNRVAMVVITVAMLIGVSSVVWVLRAEESPTGAENSQVEAAGEATTPDLYPVTIHKPDGPPRVATSLVDDAGHQVTVSCATCHATRQPTSATKTSGELKEFHVDLQVSHGTVTCLSCHNSDDYDTLKLADGTRVDYVDVMTLCGQCHGPQLRDYQHNVHGGMNGYWDRSRGPQTKLNCVDCHHPHAPQFPKMHPTFKPQDRFLSPIGAGH